MTYDHIDALTERDDNLADERPGKTPRYDCRDNTCGAPDCATCHNGVGTVGEGDDEEAEQPDGDNEAIAYTLDAAKVPAHKATGEALSLPERVQVLAKLYAVAGAMLERHEAAAVAAAVVAVAPTPAPDPEEGDQCPEEDCDGHLEVVSGRSCSCHISPPCASCVEDGLACDTCGARTGPDHAKLWGDL